MINKRYSLGHATLIVEDDPNFRDVLDKVCRGCFALHCIKAEDGTQGLESYLINSQIIGSVIIDLNMPRLNGYELIRLIRQKETEGNPVRIAATSVRDDRYTQNTAFEFGADVFVSKNTSLFDIIGKLSDFF